MKRFDKNKYLRKIKIKRWLSNYSRYLYLGLSCILVCTLGVYLAYSKFFVSKEEAVIKTTVGNFIQGDVVIGAYIDNEYSSTIPGKDDGYVVEKIVCDNDATAEWDNDKWGLLTTNLSKRTKCNVYFKKDYLGPIIAQLDTSGKCPTMNADGSVNVTAVEATNGYLCKAKDAYGDSYYYRGNVTNNYVKFGRWSDDVPDIVRGYYSASSTSYKEYSSLEECQSASSYNVNCTLISNAGKEMYWRIVRINGDGTVRVIYDGTAAHANGESSSDRQIGISAFNKPYIDNAHIGYMYGDRTDIVEPTTQYSTVSFTNTSTYYIAKEYIYDSSTDMFTLKDPIAVLGSAMSSDYVGYYTFGNTSSSVSYHSVLKIFSVTADSSSTSVGYGYVTYATTSKEDAQTNKNDSTIKIYLDNWYKTNIVGTENEQYLADNVFCNDRSFNSSNSGTGAGMSITYYRWGKTGKNIKMMLTCPQQNDAFTVSDTSKGNGALTYPVGLLSTDEVVLAGGWGARNEGYYLYSGQDWWTLSPQKFQDKYATMQYVMAPGYTFNHNTVYSIYGVRPVFNLKAEVLAQGSGTASDPYRIS